MTERESAHPSSQTEFAEFAPANESELINELDEPTSKSAESVWDLISWAFDKIRLQIFLVFNSLAVKELSQGTITVQAICGPGKFISRNFLLQFLLKSDIAAR